MNTPEYEDGVLAALRQQAKLLAAEVTGPLRRIQISQGDAAVEVEWHGASPAVDPARPVVASSNGTLPVVAPPVVAPPNGALPGAVPWGAAAGAVQSGPTPPGLASPGAIPSGAVSAGAVPATGPVPAAGDGPGPVGGAGRYSVVSPMVGTFYRSPEPGATPFVAIGDLVEPSRVIGIVEAMKLMNEITAGQAGRVLDVLVDDGQPVEFGQALIALAPA